MEDMTIEITSLSQDGRGVGRLDGRVCFVEGALPGEVVRARIVREKRSLLEAVALGLVVSSPARCQPVCTESRCGGCPLRTMEYQAQLEAKRRIVEEQLVRIGKIPDARVLPMVGMDDPFGYRNRVRLVWNGQNLVFRARRSHESGGRIGACRIASSGVVSLALAVEECLKNGSIRMRRECEVLVRQGLYGFIGFSGDREGWVSDDAFEFLSSAGAATIVCDLDEWETGFFGEEYRPDIEYHVCGMAFSAKGRSFFQTNAWMAERLFADVLAGFAGDSRGTVIDLYGGVGAPGLLFAREGWSVISVEIDPLAVRSAAFNAARAGLAFEACEGDAALVLPALLGQHPDALLLVDPPRAGLASEVSEALCRHAPQRIVMISCDPATMARDAGRLIASGRYRLEPVRTYDMFPWTNHIESLAVFSRRD